MIINKSSCCTCGDELGEALLLADFLFVFGCWGYALGKREATIVFEAQHTCHNF